LIIGGGAAGLAVAVFTASLQPGWRVQLLGGGPVLGAKLLLSGGGRCNITHRAVSEDDFNGAPQVLVRRVLRAFSVRQTLAFFREIGVGVREEPDGRVMAARERARDVRDALVAAARARGVQLDGAARVAAVAREAEALVVRTAQGATIAAPRVVLATGGRSYPQTGSDGSGYVLARALGHSIVAPTPALVPLVLEGDFHRGLSGVSHSAALRVRVAAGRSRRLTGALLWTHFGISGPLALDASRHWLRSRMGGVSEPISLAFCPGEEPAELDRRLLAIAEARPRVSLATVLTELLPRAIADAVLAELKIPATRAVSQLPRDDRRRLVRALCDWPLHVRESRGWAVAEVTAGGVPLEEVDCATMASRRCRGLYLAGELLDVDGRVGGFNLQWVWSSAHAAAQGLTKA
jgi:predicted Rossmann fold flavoprotein